MSEKKNMEFKQEDLLNYVSEKFGDSVFNFNFSHGITSLETTPETLIPVLTFLKEHPILNFNFLTDICGVHYPEREKSLGVVYHLHSFTKGIRLRLKVFVSDDNPTVPSAVSLWNSANWMERETYDFFGIQFEGHPNLKRILNIDSMEVHPMRKEHPLEDPNRADKDDSFFGR